MEPAEDDSKLPRFMLCAEGQRDTKHIGSFYFVIDCRG
jgi:hypothetical protein